MAGRRAVGPVCGVDAVARCRRAGLAGPLLLGFALRPLTGVPWWRFVPLGLFERGLAAEVAVVIVLGLWAARAPAGRTPYGRCRWCGGDRPVS